jgi:hypothetical protein
MQMVVFTNNATSATTLSWIADQDYLAIGVTGANGIISNDPSLTAANFRDAPAALKVSQRWVLDAGNMYDAGLTFAFPIKKGEKIYCACPAVIGPTYLILEETQLL